MLSGGQISFNGNYPFAGGDKGQYLERTSRCGSFPQAVNNFGLWDMHGNVSEWCEDYYSPAFYSNSKNPDPVCDKEDPKFKGCRVLRGGYFDSSGSSCRAASRDWGYAGSHYSNDGFRVCGVRTP